MRRPGSTDRRPAGLAAGLLRRPVAPPRQPRGLGRGYDGDSIADWYVGTHTWADVLGPHGCTLVIGNGDDDGSRWRHPTATSDVSATVRYGCLFVYTPNTVFEPTEAEDPHGSTRSRAYAVLDHGSDLSAAGRAARTRRGEVA